MTDSTGRSAGRRRVVIACQGGGSHTAFAAGVLKRLMGAPELDGFEIVGLSGTSGGAVCALLAWYALRDDEASAAGDLLQEFWSDNAARAPLETVLNRWTVWMATLQTLGTLPSISPYHTPISLMGANLFREMLRRHIDFGRLSVDTEARYPLLLLGAVDVLSGQFRAFNSRRDPITPDVVLASAAIPNLFRSVHLPDGAYWDGLFSQNPPIHDLLDVHPDELWVIQVNPQQRSEEPMTLLEIADRRNELGGNLSLYQELSFIEKIDDLLESGLLNPGHKYKQIVIRVIELSRASLGRRLGAASKLDRDPRFLEDLIAHGQRQAEEFLAALLFEKTWQSGQLGPIVNNFDDDAEIVSEAPFGEPGTYRGKSEIKGFLERQLSGRVHMDLTRKQVARERVYWTVKHHGNGDGTIRVGQVEATFDQSRIRRLMLRSFDASTPFS